MQTLKNQDANAPQYRYLRATTRVPNGKVPNDTTPTPLRTVMVIAAQARDRRSQILGREHVHPIIGSMDFASIDMSEAFLAGTTSTRPCRSTPSPATPTMSFEPAHDAMLPVSEEQQLSSASSSEQVNVVVSG
ncbi:hypothetical protein E8E14_013047 [Neopestalotiopsis sp. 37M]|nr:hypothetical protein E8E14_013047 [Neopestalotiopsis sp. 37M]